MKKLRKTNQKFNLFEKTLIDQKAKLSLTDKKCYSTVSVNTSLQTSG